MPWQVTSEPLRGNERAGAHVSEMQRRRLLLAFGEVLAEDGLEAAGVGRVCSRAGVSRRTFYDLFDDREGCFLAVFDATLERVCAHVAPAFSGAGRWSERLRGALAALLDLCDEEPWLVRVCLIETLKAGPAALERRAQALQALIGAVDQGRLEAKGTGVAPAPLTAESMVGGAASVICGRVLAHDPRPVSELLNQLMSMIVQPYLGTAAARRELEREVSDRERAVPAASARGNGQTAQRVREPFKDLPIRITFRTARVLAAIASQPGASNRQVGGAAGVVDQGQMSKLLSRLEDCGLIENHSEGHDRGEPNAWRLTARGEAVQRAIELPTEQRDTPASVRPGKLLVVG